MVKRCSNCKQCATCEYWAGQRSVDRNPKWVEVDSGSRAKCMSTGPFRGQEMRESSMCKAYRTWRYME